MEEMEVEKRWQREHPLRFLISDNIDLAMR